jgi:hypothetical protein
MACSGLMRNHRFAPYISAFAAEKKLNKTKNKKNTNEDKSHAQMQQSHACCVVVMHARAGKRRGNHQLHTT